MKRKSYYISLVLAGILALGQMSPVPANAEGSPAPEKAAPASGSADEKAISDPDSVNEKTSPDSDSADEKAISDPDSVNEKTSPDSDSADEKAISDFPLPDVSDMFSSRDRETDYSPEESIRIELKGDSISSDSDSVDISGTTVTITGEGTYLLSGTLNDGMIVVNAGDADKPHLILNGVSVNSETSAALYISEADKVFVTLAPDTENTLSNGGAFSGSDDSIDAAVFSRQDLTFNGSGSLKVLSPSGHGITGKDDLKFTGGSYSVEAASHGIDANDSLCATGSSFSITSGKDGIRAQNDEDETLGYVYIPDGSFHITAEGDGISASSFALVEGGEFDILAGGGSENSRKITSDLHGGFRKNGREGFPDMQAPESEDETAADTSAKGIKASGDLFLMGGTFLLDSADDSVHSNSSIYMNGGVFRISTGDDGFHAEESLTISEGTVQITDSYEGLEALHIDISGGEFDITARDDGINAAGGTDSSGMDGFWGRPFGGRGGRMNGASGSSADTASGDGTDGSGTDSISGRNTDGVSGSGTGSIPSQGTIVISGGKIYTEASGDGIDSNGSVEISGGYIIVCGPSQGDTSVLDYNTSGIITGGTFIGTGGSMMAQTFSESTQGVIAVNAGNQPEGTEITLSDSSGNLLLSRTPALPFSVVILSSPDLASGETCTITVGALSEEFTAD